MGKLVVGGVGQSVEEGDGAKVVANGACRRSQAPCAIPITPAAL